MRFLHALSFAVTLVAVVAAPALAVPHAGDAAPAFTLPKVSGGDLTLASLHGKATYLNFFASWCAPCNAEASTVASLYSKYHTRGLTIVGVNEQEDKAKALDFAHKYKWPFTIAVDDGEMGKNYGAFGLPVHVFIDKRGQISTYRLGEMDPNEIEDAIKKII